MYLALFPGVIMHADRFVVDNYSATRAVGWSIFSRTQTNGLFAHSMPAA